MPGRGHDYAIHAAVEGVKKSSVDTTHRPRQRPDHIAVEVSHDRHVAGGEQGGQFGQGIGQMNVHQIGIELFRPQWKRWRYRTGKQLPHGSDPCHMRLAVFVLGATTSVGDKDMEVDLVKEAVADVFKNGFHSADNGIIKLSKL